jgi:hypothetical protein
MLCWLLLYNGYNIPFTLSLSTAFNMYGWISFSTGYDNVYGIDYVIGYAIGYAIGHTIENVKIFSLNGLLHWVCAIRNAIVIVFGYTVSYALTAPFAMPLAIPMAMLLSLPLAMPSAMILVIDFWLLFNMALPLFIFLVYAFDNDIALVMYWL